MGNIVTIDEQVFTDIADAIRDKNGTEETYKPGEMAAAIGDIETGGGGDEPEPTDGKTHIWIHIDPDTPANRLSFPLYFGQSVSRGVTVDWGDGSATEIFYGTAETTHTHKYATGGDYEITLEVTDGTLNLTGTSSTSGYAIYGSKASSYAYNRTRIRRVHIGGGVARIGTYAFYNCYGLTSITIPDGVTSIDGSAFSYCYSLTSITIPDGVTSIGSSAFSNCYNLTSVTIPDDVTSIGVSTFSGCYSLTSITIPDGVTSIGASTFNSCYSLTSITIPDGVTSIGISTFSGCFGIVEYHLLPTTPPTLANTNAFNGIASDCIIYVPYSEDHSILEAYKTATNWSTYASKMQEEPA